MVRHCIAPLLAALVLGSNVGLAHAQGGNTLREQLIGTWEFVIAEIATADGRKSFPFGGKPKGILIFTPEGRFAQTHISSGLPRIPSNNRLAGSDEENKAIVHGTLALFGTYSVDEAKRTVTYKIEASTFPNWEGVEQTRTIDALSADEFRNTNQVTSRGAPAVATNLYRRVR